MSHNDSTENKRRQLLEAFGRQRGAGSRDAITRQARPADLPASAEQLRMWVQMAVLHRMLAGARRPESIPFAEATRS